ncbi:MAG: HupE/UreJ family protein [Bacteroidales bacterium]|nr:HupE/UreJ family protein [Bacteroidales bacterium]
MFYLQLGFEHIADLRGYDHILFIISLCAVYTFHQWKKVLILVTAFTIGHSVTLALATLKIIRIPTDLVEFLIPLTIFITAFANIFNKTENFSNSHHLFKYFMALIFGFIHGMGFSNFLRSILGNEDSILLPLLSFNVGLEIGQIFIVFIILSLAYLVIDLFRYSRREWTLILSGAGIGVSLILMLERI